MGLDIYVKYCIVYNKPFYSTKIGEKAHNNNNNDNNTQGYS